MTRDSGGAGGGGTRSAGPSSKWELAEVLANAHQTTLTGGASKGGSKGMGAASPGSFATPAIGRSFQRGRSDSSMEEDAAEVEPSPATAAPVTKSHYSSAVESLDYEARLALPQRLTMSFASLLSTILISRSIRPSLETI